MRLLGHWCRQQYNDMAKKVTKGAQAVEATAGPTATKVDEKAAETPNVESVKETAPVKLPEAKEPAKKADDVKPAEKEKLAKKAAELFKLYPLAKTLYFTSDETAFFELHDAANHSASLADKKVKPINRTEV